jgi:uncharacterized protein (DUF1330 family)
MEDAQPMSAYVIVSYDIVDPAGFEGYVPAVMPLLEKHGAEVLVGSFDAKALEGEASGVHVVLRFPSEEAALAWYNDPAYGPVKQIRFRSTANARMALASGFEPPQG